MAKNKKLKKESKKGGISEATAIGGAAAGAGIGAIIAATITTGELRKRIIRIYLHLKKAQRKKKGS